MSAERAPGGPVGYDVLIVGGGPAGLSAALVLARARRSVLVVDDGQPRNASAEHVGGYLGLEGIGPLELLARGREQVAAYGVEVRDGRAVSACEARHGDGFEVTVEDGTVFRGRKLLLCTGVSDELPEVEGARSFYGRGVHHCPYCDGWTWRDRPLAAFGRPDHAISLALSLLTWSPDVTVLTHGERVPDDLAARVRANGLKLRTRRVRRLVGRTDGADGDGSDGDRAALGGAELEGGETLRLDALFFSARRNQHSDLPRLLGCTLDDLGEVVTDRQQGTGVRGLYLAGDASGDVQFVIAAAAEGAKAAVHINREMQAEERV